MEKIKVTAYRNGEKVIDIFFETINLAAAIEGFKAEFKGLNDSIIVAEYENQAKDKVLS